MSNKQKPIDPIPEEFASYEEAAEFWDAHDTTDYLDDFETVAVEVDFKHRRYEVEIDEDLVMVLREHAQQRGVALSQLVSDMLREQMRAAA